MRNVIYEVEYLRAFAMLGVIAIHTSIGGNYPLQGITMNQILQIIANDLTRFAVPFFIIISGMVLSFNQGNRTGGFKNYIKKRVIVILIPYLFFTFLYYYLFLYSPNMDFFNGVLLEKIVKGNAAPQLYFVVEIFQLYLLFPVFLILSNYLAARGKTFQIAFFIFLGLAIVYSVYEFSLFRIGFPTFITHSHYFLLGCIMGSRMELLKDIVNKISIGPIVVIWVIFGFYLFLDSTILYGISIYSKYHYYFYFFGMTGYTLGTFLALWRLSSYIQVQKNSINGVFFRLGSFSYGIFLVHYFFVKYLYSYIPYPVTSGPHLIIYFIAVLALSYVAVLAIKSTKIGGQLIGVRCV